MQKLLIILTILLSLLLYSCASKQNYSTLGKVNFNSHDPNYFTFLISDEYLKANFNSPADKNYPKMSKAEAKLLIEILKQNGNCLNKYGKLDFEISSKQEKIYDTTFLHLIEQNYNARSAVPTMYFGHCK